jgi:hypothetical protein
MTHAVADTRAHLHDGLQLLQLAGLVHADDLQLAQAEQALLRQLTCQLRLCFSFAVNDLDRGQRAVGDRHGAGGEQRPSAGVGLGCCASRRAAVATHSPQTHLKRCSPAPSSPQTWAAVASDTHGVPGRCRHSSFISLHATHAQDAAAASGSEVDTHAKMSSTRVPGRLFIGSMAAWASGSRKRRNVQVHPTATNRHSPGNALTGSWVESTILTAYVYRIVARCDTLAH